MPEWWYEDTFDSIRQGFQVERVHEEQTPHQHLAVYLHPSLGHVLVLDGIVQTTEGDEWVYHEILAHVPLNGLKRAPESVLIIGGGDGGLLRQVLKYESVRRATLVEIDQAVVAVSRRYLGFSDAFADERVELVFADGAAYVNSPAARKTPYDAVLIDSSDPEGPATVLFEMDFYRAVGECLASDGVVARQAGIPMYGPEVLAHAARAVREAFGALQVCRAPVPTYIGGDMAFVVASKDGARLDEPRAEFTGRFYNASVHRAAFALPTWWRDLAGGAPSRAGPR